MIHVQIASQVSMQGVGGVRWVLVEQPETPPAHSAVAAMQAVAAGAALAGASPAQAGADRANGADQVDTPQIAHTAGEADGWKLAGMKLLVVALGLGAAAWTARLQIGPNTLSLPSAQTPTGSATPPATTDIHVIPVQPVLPAASAAPARAAQPAAPEPATPASDAAPRLTAALP